MVGDVKKNKALLPTNPLKRNSSIEQWMIDVGASILGVAAPMENLAGCLHGYWLGCHLELYTSDNGNIRWRPTVALNKP